MKGISTAPHSSFALLFLTFLLGVSSPTWAVLTSEEKMDLFTQALAARDAGDYHIARQNLEVLAKDSPGDPLVESS